MSDVNQKTEMPSQSPSKRIPLNKCSSEKENTQEHDYNDVSVRNVSSVASDVLRCKLFLAVNYTLVLVG